MQIGLLGLGRMGNNMRSRLRGNGFEYTPMHAYAPGYELLELSVRPAEQDPEFGHAVKRAE